MEFILGFVRRAWTLVLPLTGIIIAATVLFFTGHKDAAWFVSYPGSAVVVLGNVFYIAVFDPLNRWPRDSWGRRLLKTITFSR